MGFDLEQLDPHVEISREELELGLPPSILSDALKEVQDTGYRIGMPTVGNSQFFREYSLAGPDGKLRAFSTSAAEDGSGSHPDIMSRLQFSMCEASLKGTGEEDDLVRSIKLNLRSDEEIQQGETSIFRQPLNAVAASYSILPWERLTEHKKHEPAKDSSLEITPPICKESHDEKSQGKEVLSSATKPGNGSKDVSLQKEVRGTCPKVTSKPHKEHSNGEDCAETEDSGPTEEALQRLQSESEGPNSGSLGLPTSFSGLFQSILASDNPASQLVETGSRPNGLLAASSTAPIVSQQAVTDIVNSTTKLMLNSLNQPPLRPPGFLQMEKRNRMKTNTAVAALEARDSQTSYQEARVASAATAVSAAASAAKSAVQAAEASIEALANLGINNGSLYQGRNSYVNPRPLKVACGSRPVAAGVKRTFQDQRPPIVEQSGGKNTTGTLDLIKVGSAVEVMPQEDGLQGGWFIAKVLFMTSKEALVVYDDLMTDDGCSHLEESFPLHCSREEDSFGTTVLAAQGWVRPVHPFSSSQKRGHFLTVCENWVVGDRVDAFVDDGWWEAIIEDLNKADETKITVFFPGDGTTMVMKAWNVRPCLIWKKGEWRPCRGDSVEQAYPPSKRQKTSSTQGKVERELTKPNVAAAVRNPARRTREPRRSGASINDDKGMVIYAKKKDIAGQSLVTPTRELRSATRSHANVAQTKMTPASKTPIANALSSKATLNGSSALTRSQQMSVAVTPELTWDVRRQSTRLQQKEVSQSPQDAVRPKTPSSRLSKKEVLIESPQYILGRRKTPSRRSQHSEVIKTPKGNALAIIPLPAEAPGTRSRTQSQRLAATKR